MAEILILRARLGRRDKDIRRAIKRLDLEDVVLSDLVRDGFRMILKELGVMETVDNIDPIIERSEVAR